MIDPGDDPLAGATILGVLEESERKFLASRGRHRKLDKGQILFTEGERSDSVLVLLSGHMKVLRYSRDGDPFIVNTVLPGDSIGEVGVFSKGPRSATVQAGEKCEVLELPASVIMDLISKRPAACIALLECVSAMVRRLTDVAADLVFLDLSQRVAKYLLDGRSGRFSLDYQPIDPVGDRRKHRRQSPAGQRLPARVRATRLDQHGVQTY